MPVEMKTVQSSAVWQIGYDADTNDLHVRFIPAVKHPAGRLVIYHGVPPDVAQDVIDAPSVGIALNQSIKGTYSFSG